MRTRESGMPEESVWTGFFDPAGILRTLGRVFPHVQTWRTHADLLLVASKEPIDIDASRLRARLGAEPWAEAMLDTWRVTDLEGFLARPAEGEGPWPGVLVCHAWKGVGPHDGPGGGPRIVHCPAEPGRLAGWDRAPSVGSPTGTGSSWASTASCRAR